MINALRGKALLNGARGQAPSDVDALVDAICALANFAHVNREAIVEVQTSIRFWYDLKVTAQWRWMR